MVHRGKEWAYGPMRLPGGLFVFLELGFLDL